MATRNFLDTPPGLGPFVVQDGKVLDQGAFMGRPPPGPRFDGSLPVRSLPSVGPSASPSVVLNERPRCISFTSSAEIRCDSPVFLNRKYCEYHLSLLPKKRYHDLDDINVDMVLTPELGISTLMDLYVKTQNIIDLRDAFLEKHVSLECRDRGHRVRRWLLVSFQERCEKVIQQIYDSWVVEKPKGDRLELDRPSAKKETATQTEQVSKPLQKSYEKSKKAFKATKKRTQDWEGGLLEEIEYNRSLVNAREKRYARNLRRIAGPLPSGGNITSDHVFKFGAFLREIYPPSPSKKGREKAEREFIKISDMRLIFDPAMFRVLWFPIRLCTGMNVRLDNVDLFEEFLCWGVLPLISKKQYCKDRAEEFRASVTMTEPGSVAGSQWWSFIESVYDSEDFIIINTCLGKPKPCGCYEEIARNFYFVVLFGEEPSFWFFNQARKEYSVKRINSVKELEYLDAPMGMEASKAEAMRWCKPFSLVKVSWTLMKRIMISAKLGERGYEMIRNDIDEYDKFRKEVLR